MWIQTKPNGIYACESAYDAVTGRRRILTVKIPKDTKQARKEAQRRLQAKLDAAKPSKLKLSKLIDLYKKDLERTVRRSTYNRNSCSLNTMLKITGDFYVEKMTAGYIREKLTNSGKDNTTLNELIKRFKSMLNWAYMNDYLPDKDVYNKLKKYPDVSAKEKVEDKFLEKDELHTLLEAMDLERWKLLTEFLALSGLRIGEALALDHEDISDEYISVTKSYTEGLRSLGATKTKGSNRNVYIQPELAEVIKKIRLCMMRQRMRYGYEDNGYFFTGIDGERVGYAAYNKYLKEIAAKAVPDKKVTPHTLRHTMTSLFAEAGVPLESISRRLGHENSELTKEIYLHITKPMKEQDNEEFKSVNLLA